MPYKNNEAPISLRLAAALCLTLTGSTNGAFVPAEATPGKTDFGPYIKLVQNKIHWTPPAKTTASKVSVSFVIGKTGSISDLKIKEASGDSAVDQLALQTIQKAAPLPPLPAGEPSFELTFTFPCQSGVTVDGVDTRPYTQAVFKRIRECWWVPKRLMFMQVNLSFEINKDGSLARVSIDKSSNDKNADRLAMISVKRASPFKPLPEGVSGPMKLTYSFGFKDEHDKNFYIFNGERFNSGQSFTTAGGSKVGHKDETTDKDKAFHLRKEEALIKMSDLEEQIDKERKANPDSLKLVPLLLQYANHHRSIEEHVDALNKLNEAVVIARKNSTANQKELAQSLGALGCAQYNLGNTKEAEPLLKEAIEIKENVLKESDKDLKELLETYARMLYKQGRIKEYEEVSKKARELTVK